MSTQRAFAAALLDPARRCPDGLVSWNGSDPAQRFAVYLNNVVSSLIGALSDTFPVTRELVGDEFFRAMAREFVLSSPPSSTLLAAYGAGFARFIEGFEPAASLPYLSDVARLEWLRLVAFHSADATPVGADRIAALLAEADLLPQLRLQLHPSVGVLSSRYAVVSLWAAHQGSLDIGAVDPYRPEHALVVRPALEVLVIDVPAAAAVFVQCLRDGASLGEAHASAQAAAEDFDLAMTLALLIRHRALSRFDPSLRSPS
ncbi:DNA-binding domain-containing protein [Roseateles sp.]|uniref:HvfC/BufC N-terminal domain-containing protein n=1 Tax=Roseateles sp. TaxID=1971397 RepID=UPI00286BCA7F|nr:DNA-binding domain-containing protein [Roseateles sp.]